MNSFIEAQILEEIKQINEALATLNKILATLTKTILNQNNK